MVVDKDLARAAAADEARAAAADEEGVASRSVGPEDRPGADAHRRVSRRKREIVTQVEGVSVADLGVHRRPGRTRPCEVLDTSAGIRRAWPGRVTITVTKTG